MTLCPRTQARELRPAPANQPLALALALTLVSPASAVWAAPARPTPTARPTAAGTAATGQDDGEDGAELTGDEGGAATHVCHKRPRGEKFLINLPKEAELEDLINWMMGVSCQKFIWDPKVRGGKVTLLSPEMVTVDEAYAAFYAALQTMGLTVEPSGKYFKIVETAKAKNKTLPVYGPDGRAPNNDRYVTQLYRVESGNPAEIATLLDKLKSENGSIDPVGDLMIITDTGSNVRRMLKIVQQLDDPKISAEKIFFFQLRYADPETIAETVREIFGEKGGTAGASKAKSSKSRSAAATAATTSGAEPSFSRVIVDERTGTLIIVAQEQDYHVIRRLIQQLDVPLSGGAGRIHVVKLKNADPEEVATVLTNLGSGAQSQGNAGRRGSRNAQQQAAPPTPPPGVQPGETFSGDIRVTADPATRSLVILASQSDFEALRAVIEALDAERKQVYIEVYLLELRISKNFTFGMGGHFGAPVNVDAPGGGTSGPGLGFVSSTQGANNTIQLDPSVLSGLAAGVLGPQITGTGALTGLGRDVPAFGVILQALQTNSDVNFVATPHMTTADNQEANIEVGSNVPTPGTLSFNPSGAAAGGGLTAFPSIQRQDVALSVKVTPHVNDEKTVTLDIEMENNEIAGNDPKLGITTSKRKLKLDKVVARDDQPLVLGGLMRDVETEGVTQIPGLGSIPVLGWLFKRKTRSKEKVNLLMILIPHVIETPDDQRRIHKRRMDERLEFLERYTAFKRRDLDTAVNYRKKSGLLATVNAEASRMEGEEIERERAEQDLQRTEITGEIGLSPRQEGEEEEDDASAEASGTTVIPRPAAFPTNQARRGATVD